MRTIPFDDPALRSMGRIDDDDPRAPVWVFPYTQVSFRCTGSRIRVKLRNHWNYGDILLGAIIDGLEVKVPVPIDTKHDGISMENGYPNRVPNASGAELAAITVDIAEHLPDIEHEVTIFKRQDGGMCHLEMLGIELDDDAAILPPADTRPTRRIEVYGDSVSCGERNEAVRYVGQADPEADLSGYSDSWHSYAAIAARALGAELHDVSQGGAPLLDGIGWFNAPHYLGMESIWDRIEYNPALGGSKPWDFARYTPHVVLVALGQNDAHPHDFMAADYAGETARRWRARYVDFVHALRARYPKALIVLATTILVHDPAWDRAIGEVCETVRGEGDTRVEHFLYSRNASGTYGHPRIPEDEEMAGELVAYLESFGPGLWE